MSGKNYPETKKSWKEPGDRVCPGNFSGGIFWGCLLGDPGKPLHWNAFFARIRHDMRKIDEEKKSTGRETHREPTVGEREAAKQPGTWTWSRYLNR